jgi:malonate transporter and related proteins
MGPSLSRKGREGQQGSATALMEAAFDIVVPMFALMLCGYLAVRLRILGADGIRGLSDFVFFFAIPALLFHGISSSRAAEHDELSIVYAYFLACLILFAVTMVVGRLVFRLKLAEQAIMAFTATFSNTVLLGIPIIYTAFGERGVLPVTLITSFHSIILLTLATTIIEIGQGHGGRVLHSLPKTFLALVRNPLLLSIVAGFAMRLAGWHSPVIVDGFLKLLTGAAAPCALFALGATLASFQLGGGVRETLFLTVMKMVVHPLLVWFVVSEVFALAPIQVAVAVILAALPAGQNGFILAQRYGIYVERSAGTVLITTAISVVTAALLVAHYANVP